MTHRAHANKALTMIHKPTAPRFALCSLVLAAASIAGCASTPSQLGITDPGVQLTAKGLATALQSTVKYKGACEIDVKGATADRDTAITTRCIGDARYDGEVMEQIRRVYDPETPDFSTAVWATGWDELLQAKLVQPRVATSTRFAQLAVSAVIPPAEAAAEKSIQTTALDASAPPTVTDAVAGDSIAEEAVAVGAVQEPVAVAASTDSAAAPAAEPLAPEAVSHAKTPDLADAKEDLGPVVIDYSKILAARPVEQTPAVEIPTVDEIPAQTAQASVPEQLLTLPVVPEGVTEPPVAQIASTPPALTVAAASAPITPAAMPEPEMSPGVDMLAAAALAKQLATVYDGRLVHQEVPTPTPATPVATDEDLIGRLSTGQNPAPESVAVSEPVKEAPIAKPPVPVGPTPAELAAAAALEKVRREWTRLSDAEQATRLASLAYSRELPPGFTRTPIADDRRSTRLWGQRAIRGMTRISSPILNICAVEYEVLALAPQTLDVADFNDPVFASDPLEIRVEPTRLDARQNRARLVIVQRNDTPAI